MYDTDLFESQTDVDRIKIALPKRYSMKTLGIPLRKTGRLKRWVRSRHDILAVIGFWICARNWRKRKVSD
jgi:hypothetical protein